MNQKSILKINDSLYDSVTGELISGPKIEKTVVEAKIKEAREAAKHAAAHTRQKSKTLMRSAVKKPSVKQTNENFKKSLPITKDSADYKKLSAHSINQSRLESARQTIKHDKVSKFAKTTNNDSVLSVKNSETPNQVKSSLKSRPNTTEDLLMHAVARATSHENTYEGQSVKSSKLPMRKVSLALAGVVIIAFLVIGVIPQAQLKLASKNAGFSISKPSYKPAGFSLSQINTESGSAKLIYKSNSDDRKILISEKISNWNNETLSGVLAMSTDDKQIITPKGTDIFIGKQGNATWIRNGVQFEINSAGALSNKQIAQIVDSL